MDSVTKGFLKFLRLRVAGLGRGVPGVTVAALCWVLLGCVAAPQEPGRVASERAVAAQARWAKLKDALLKKESRVIYAKRMEPGVRLNVWYQNRLIGVLHPGYFMELSTCYKLESIRLDRVPGTQKATLQQMSADAADARVLEITPFLSSGEPRAMLVPLSDWDSELSGSSQTPIVSRVVC